MPGQIAAAAAASKLAAAAAAKGGGGSSLASIAKIVGSGAPGAAEILKTIVGNEAQQINNNERNAAIREVQEYKKAYGLGVSTLIMIENGTGAPLTLSNAPAPVSFHGRLHQGAWDPTIDAGFTETVLHVKKDAAMKGSSGAVVYEGTTPNGTPIDVFFGWDTPYSGKNYCFCEVMPRGHWSGEITPQWMKDNKITGLERETYRHDFMGCVAIASIGQSASPILHCSLQYRRLDPLFLTVKGKTATSVDLELSQVVGAKRYFVYVDNHAEAQDDFVPALFQQIEHVDDTSRSVKIDGLRADSICRIVVAAQDEYGVSVESETLAVRTQASAAA
ncbi:MAG: fibronectin type III domain-containing protein [Deltaproteobacteria bacterium]|jgi:hypothetical protein